MKAVSASLSSSLPVRFLTQAEAVAIDVSLMKEDEEGFSVDQLMELAGLSVASAIGRHFFFSSPPLCAPSSRRCLVIAGPGNNGGDGLVAARHLFHMGAKVSVFYPKQKREVALYGRLVRQCERLQIPFLSQLPAEDLSNHFDLVVDAIFGYSFNGEIREPFAKIISALSRHPRVASIDIPSGWDVEKGDVLNTGLNPALLISLTAPKKCASFFSGVHYLGGRFVPPSMAEQYHMSLPPYPADSHVVRLN